MNTLTRLRGALTLLLTLVFVGNLLMVPQIARAGGDKKKKPHIPIIVGPPIITPDHPKGPGKKHDDSGQSSDPAASLQTAP